MRTLTKIAVLSAILSLCTAIQSNAQVLVPEGYELVDSVIFVRSASADSSLVGKNVFDIMPSRLKGDKADVIITQDSLLLAAMRSHIIANSGKPIRGYRIRIYYDNSQNARNESMWAYSTAINYFHVSAYRGYSNPYFKVTIGDCRTKSEAQKLLNMVKGTFPSAFIVRESIHMPSIHSGQGLQTDTIKVLRKITYFE